MPAEAPVIKTQSVAMPLIVPSLASEEQERGDPTRQGSLIDKPANEGKQRQVSAFHRARLLRTRGFDAGLRRIGFDRGIGFLIASWVVDK